MGSETTSTEGTSTAGRIRCVLARGMTLGRYVLQRELGRGAMGRVWLARDRRLGREVALKTLRDSAVVDPDAIARFVREAQALAQLRHPNVVEVYEVAILEGIPCIALEYVAGPNLRTWLAHPRRNLDQILAVFHGAAQGLIAAHAAGLIHRDFKPANVMVDRDGRARVMDFGLVRLSSGVESRHTPTVAPGEDCRLTATGTVMGTPRYMAPEQHRGDPLDARADQYAFCTALFEAVIREAPFGVDKDDVLALALAKHTGKLVRPRLRAAPRWLVSVLARGLAPDPRDRWPSMKELARALARGARPRRHRPLVLAACTLALGLAWPSERPHSGPCDRSAPAEPGWDTAAAAELAGSWEAGNARDADVRHRVVAALDDYVARWQAARSAACDVANAQVDHVSAAVACLDDCRSELTATIEALSDAPDRALAQQSLAMVGNLPAPETCSAQVDTRPTGIGSLAARDQLARVRARIRARRLDDVATELGELEIRARLEGAPLLAAEVATTRGDLARIDRDFPLAAGLYETAYHEAFAQGHDVLAVRALTAAIEVTGSRMSNPTEALRRAPEAAALVQRIGDPALAAALHTTLGMVLNEAGDHGLAIAHLERARELSVDARPPDLDELHLVHNATARAWNSLGDNARARAHVQLAIDYATELYGPTHPSVASATTNLGSLLAMAGDTKGAIAAFERALTTTELAFGPGHPSSFSILAGLGVTAGTRGDRALALTYHARALAVRGEPRPGDVGAARVHNNIARDLAALGRFDEATLESDRALAELEAALGPGHTMIATAEQTRAEIERRRGRLAAAELHLDRAVAIFESSISGRHDELASAWTARSVLALALGRPQQALHAAERALATFELRSDGENLLGADAYEARGRALGSLGRLDAARADLDHASALFARRDP